MFAFLCMSLHTLHSNAEQTDVEGVDPVSGESYYLYNVGAGKFLVNGNSYNTQASLAPYGLKIKVVKTSDSDDVYKLRVVSTLQDMYIDGDVYLDYSESSGDVSLTRWSLTKQESGYYKIQCSADNPKYKETSYLGWNNDNNNSRVQMLTTGSLEWAFVTEETYGKMSSKMPTENYAFPTLTTAALSAGSTYYLYNVDARQFMYLDNSNMYVGENAHPVQISKLDNGAYTIRFTNVEKGYVYGYDRDCRSNSWYDSSDKQTYWRILDVGDDTYTIQCSPLNDGCYNSITFMGWQGCSNKIDIWRTKDYGTKWKLIPADENGDKLVAQLKLYDALAKSDLYAAYGWDIQHYADLYANSETASAAELADAAYALRNGLDMSKGYTAPYWNERPILWQCSEGSFGGYDSRTWALPDNNRTSGAYFSRNMGWSSASSSLSATVVVEEPSVFIYSTSGSDNPRVKVYVDDELVRDLDDTQVYCYYGNGLYTRFAEELTAGRHTIKWVVEGNKNSYRDYSIRNAGVMASPLITVSLLEPGSLGTEVLYNTDHIKNVRRLKIKGEMNNDDWAKIKMMHFLQDLDLSEAKITEIPEKQFSIAADTSSYFLHKMTLPEGLEKIKEEAFYYSLIDHLNIPSTTKSVGEQAFAYSHIQELELPDSLNDIYGYYYRTGTFGRMYWLESIKLPKYLKAIPENMLSECRYLTDVVLPDSLETIESGAFNYCVRMEIDSFPDNLGYIGECAFGNCRSLNPKFNDKLSYIGKEAFNWTDITSLNLPESVSYIGSEAFNGCTNLEEATVSSPVWSFSDRVFWNCPKLKTLRLNCPTVAKYNTNSGCYPVDANNIANVDLVVPDIVVTSYKLDSYWYNFKSVTGFSTEEIQDWTINNPLVLNRERFAGTPDVKVVGNHDRLPSLKINGENTQAFNNLTMGGALWNYDSYAGQILSNCNNVTINGTAEVCVRTNDKTWQFFSLPYDVMVSDISHADGVQMAVRYYDGANRAENGKTGSWKDFEEDAVIPAGTGFIVQTNKAASVIFRSFNDTKQNMVANKEFVKTLEVNEADIPSNCGWNLVGNPWQCFYNNHALNFTAPITVWNTNNRTYTAYSITDDDYAIRPNEAFFVQCPDAENNTIGFPTQGRQLNAVIESQNAMKALMSAPGKRQLVDITFSDGETADRTRVVLNEQANIGYETTCDAGKMMSMEASAPQLYTIGEDGINYAINERPLQDGKVTLGFRTGKTGRYTISLGRCGVDRIFLTDNETGETVDLKASDYTFTAEAGTDNMRFALSFSYNDGTGIASADEAIDDAPVVYTMDGKRVGSGTEGLKGGVYVMRRGNKSEKVVVK